MNSSHMLVYIRTILRHVVAIDAPEVALTMITARPLIPFHAVLEVIAVGPTGTVIASIIVGHVSTWKNCFRIRTIERKHFDSSFQRSFKTIANFRALGRFERPSDLEINSSSQ